MISLELFFLPKKQLVSNSLFQAAPLLEGADEICFFLQFYLLHTYLIESHFPRKRSENMEHFSFCQKRHLFLKVTTWHYHVAKRFEYILNSLFL